MSLRTATAVTHACHAHAETAKTQGGAQKAMHKNAHHAYATQCQCTDVCGTAHVENLLEKGRHDCREWKTRAGQCEGNHLARFFSM